MATIYFISDRDGVMNLFSYDLGSKQTKKLTDYKEYDIKWPSLGPDAIVYENGGVLTNSISPAVRRAICRLCPR